MYLFCVACCVFSYDAVRRDFALSASFVLECSDGSEVTCCGGNKRS